MPRVPHDELSARRGAIPAAARRACARHGYEGVTVKVLEAETGLSRGAIFHHFRDKEALSSPWRSRMQPARQRSSSCSSTSCAWSSTG